MNKFASLIIAVSFALAASATASAADGDVTLRVDRGSVMTSQGGEFVSAQTGKVFVEGERLMVNEGSAATVFYDNGCRREYNTPGIYVIGGNCTAAAVTGTGTDWPSAAKIAGGVAIGAAILANMDETSPAVSR